MHCILAYDESGYVIRKGLRILHDNAISTVILRLKPFSTTIDERVNFRKTMDVLVALLEEEKFGLVQLGSTVYLRLRTDQTGCRG